jgi:hypothetical protein
VRAVARGDSYLDPALTSRVLTTYRRAARPPSGAVTVDLAAAIVYVYDHGIAAPR